MRTPVRSNVAENYNAALTDGSPVAFTVRDADAGLRLDVVLARLMPQHSRSRLAQWIRAGRVTVDGHVARPRHKLRPGEALLVMPDPGPRAIAHGAQALPIDLVFEDDCLMVINKPAGLVVHPGSGNRDGTLLNALLARAPALSALPRAGIVHRLDKDTSGLLVVAKTITAQTHLVRQLQARTVKREYLAVVHGRVARAGRIEAPIGRHPVRRTKMAVTARGKQAVTHYEVLERFAGATLLKCRLETGRTHQIRVHLSSIGHPLVGDPAYGRRRSAIGFPRQALHAQRLALRHPVSGNPVEWRAQWPSDLLDLVCRLRALSRPDTGHAGTARRRP